MQHSLDPDGTDRALHICFVTDDIQSFTEWMAALFGAEQPAIHDSFPPDIARVMFHGKPSDASFRQAFLSWRGTEIEIIEPGPEPSSWREFLEKNGPGVHHLGFAVRSLDATAAELEGLGAPAQQHGEFPDGRYLYSDATPRLGTMIELLEFTGGPFQSR